MCKRPCKVPASDLQVEQRGLKVKVDDEYPGGTSVNVLDEQLQFFIDERTSQLEHVKTREEKQHERLYQWSNAPRYDYVPSGTLRLTIVNSDESGVRTVWQDGKTQRVEDKLNQFLVGLVNVAEGNQRERLRWKEIERRCAEEQARAMEAQHRRWARQQKIEGVREWVLLAHEVADELDPFVDAKATTSG